MEPQIETGIYICKHLAKPSPRPQTYAERLLIASPLTIGSNRSQLTIKMAMFHQVVSILFFSLVVARVAVAENPVCIIGAGPAGLSAAYDLEAKNKSVIIFEKQAAVGGKCQAVYDS